MAGEIENERPYLKFQGQRPLSLKLKVWSFVFDFARRWKRIHVQRNFNIFRWRAKSKTKDHTFSFNEKDIVSKHPAPFGPVRCLFMDPVYITHCGFWSFDIACENCLQGCEAHGFRSLPMVEHCHAKAWRARVYRSFRWLSFWRSRERDAKACVHRILDPWTPPSRIAQEGGHPLYDIPLEIMLFLDRSHLMIYIYIFEYIPCFQDGVNNVYTRFFTS